MRTTTVRLAAIALATCLASAVQGGSPRSTPTSSEVPAASLPQPDDTSGAVEQAEDYHIGAFDTLEINVFQVDLLTRTLQVDATGHIQFPIIGEVAAAGKTPKQLGDEIAAKLDKSYLRSPQVTVYLKDSASQKFTVEGAVKSSGVFVLQGHMTLLRAIAMASGIDPDAQLRDVVIFRMVNHRRMAGLVNLGEVRKGKAEDPQIYAGDVIVVPLSASRKALHDIIGVTPLLFFLHP